MMKDGIQRQMDALKVINRWGKFTLYLRYTVKVEIPLRNYNSGKPPLNPHESDSEVFLDPESPQTMFVKAADALFFNIFKFKGGFTLIFCDT